MENAFKAQFQALVASGVPPNQAAAQALKITQQNAANILSEARAHEGGQVSSVAHGDMLDRPLHSTEPATVAMEVTPSESVDGRATEDRGGDGLDIGRGQEKEVEQGQAEDGEEDMSVDDSEESEDAGEEEEEEEEEDGEVPGALSLPVFQGLLAEAHVTGNFDGLHDYLTQGFTHSHNLNASFIPAVEGRRRRRKSSEGEGGEEDEGGTLPCPDAEEGGEKERDVVRTEMASAGITLDIGAAEAFYQAVLTADVEEEGRARQGGKQGGGSDLMACIRDAQTVLAQELYAKAQSAAKPAGASASIADTSASRPSPGEGAQEGGGEEGQRSKGGESRKRAKTALARRRHQDGGRHTAATTLAASVASSLSRRERRAARTARASHRAHIVLARSLRQYLLLLASPDLFDPTWQQAVGKPLFGALVLLPAPAKDLLKDWMAEGGGEGGGEEGGRLSRWVAGLQQYITLRCLEAQDARSYTDIKTAVRVMAILYKANQVRELGRAGGRAGPPPVPLEEFYNAGT